MFLYKLENKLTKAALPPPPPKKNKFGTLKPANVANTKIGHSGETFTCARLLYTCSCINYKTNRPQKLHFSIKKTNKEVNPKCQLMLRLLKSSTLEKH